MAQKLFSDFAPASKEDWLKQTIKDLKGKDFDDTLVWKTPEGFEIQPYYASEDNDSSKTTAIREAQNSKNSTGWKNIQKVVFRNEKETNLLIINILKKGIDAIIIDFSDTNIDSISLVRLLDGIKLSEIPVYFKTSKPEVVMEQLSKFIHYLPKGGFINDPIAEYFSGNTNFIDDSTWENTKKLFKDCVQFPQFRPLIIASDVVHNAGANAVQELAFMLASAVAYLDKLTDLGLKIEEILPKMAFSISIGTNYFIEISKLRALRFLWTKIVSEFQTKDNKSNFIDHPLYINCQTSTFYDSVVTPNTNMLRATTEAMAAVIGGCDSLTIHAFDEVFQEPTEFSERIARNISHILKEEAHLDKTSDASAGSYYIENLTIKLAEEAWQLLIKVEEIGGIVEAFECGFLKNEIEKSYQSKIEKLQNGKIMVGVNKFRVDEKDILKAEKKEIKSDKILINRRLSETFE